MRRHKKFRIRWGKLLFAGFSLYILGLLAVQQLQFWRLEEQQLQVERRIEAAEARNATLQEEIRLLQNPDYVEKLAREELNLLRDGEIPYYTIMTDEEP